MNHTQEILDLQSNETEAQEEIPVTLLLKPFGFKQPPPKVVIPRLLQAWNIKRGVTISPKKYTDDILICPSKDKWDMLHVERHRAWSVQGAHMMITQWDKGLSLEEIKFETITFWIQIRGIPPELLSKTNIIRLAEKARKVLEIDWKDTPSLLKWYVTPRALVQVPVSNPLCPGRRINRKKGNPTWVFFKYEYLKTLCYDCGILGHDQAHCTSETPAPLNLYGSWLRFDNQMDILPPQARRERRLTQRTTSYVVPTKAPASRGGWEHESLLKLNWPLIPSTQALSMIKPRLRPNSMQSPTSTEAQSMLAYQKPRPTQWAVLFIARSSTEAHTFSVAIPKPKTKQGLAQAAVQPISGPLYPQPHSKPAASLQLEARFTVPPRKRKNEMGLEDYLNLAAPFSRILKKMAITIGEEMYRDWHSMQEIGGPEPH
ncbi:hypothetical protein CRG98_044120 [Punica granatum]|uniref:Zinc knuckle CX2CX4HX4C domain-containing protein n=1 Tax=Punica granatum TaxID=22663 RepID=A0A2I0HUW6_PUNGR|nr:hypothetical protein CRG98_044120 [Punica granatum]